METVLPDMHESLVEKIKYRIPDLPPTASVAVMDWTTIDNAKRLLVEHGDGGAFDPFIALADTASLVGALILYDRLVVLDDHRRRPNTTDALAEVFEAADAFHVIEPGARKLTTSAPGGNIVYPTLDESVLQPLWDWSWRQFSPPAGSSGPAWLTLLEKNWHLVLPDTPFPPHEAMEEWREYQTSYGHPAMEEWREYRMSYGHPAGFRVDPDVRFSFRPEGTEWWKDTASTDIERIIVLNDVRSLFYEAWAKELQQALRRTHARTDITVRYLGGCLRAPMQLARADASLGLTSGVESTLQSAWRRMSGTTYPIRLPFWIDAVLARSRTPADVVENVAELRRAARRFRRRRGELEEKLRFGDEAAVAKAVAALRGEAEKTSTSADLAATAASSAAEVGMRMVAGPLTPFVDVADTAIARAKGPLSRQLLRLTAPDIWLVYHVANRAREARRSLERAMVVFDLGVELARKDSAEFMSRIGQVTWIA